MQKHGILVVSDDSSEDAQRKLKVRLEEVGSQHDKEHEDANKGSKNCNGGDDSGDMDVDSTKRARKDDVEGE